jgi:hypothetical protein
MTSEQPPPAVMSLPGPPAPESEITEVPKPRRVRTSPSPVPFAHVLTDDQLPPRRADRSRTAPSSGPADNVAIVGASPSLVPPLAIIPGDATLGATQLPTVRICPFSFVIRRHLTRLHHTISVSARFSNTQTPTAPSGQPGHRRLFRSDLGIV